MLENRIYPDNPNASHELHRFGVSGCVTLILALSLTLTLILALTLTAR